MKSARSAAVIACLIILGACQGSLSSGPSIPFTPPPGGINPGSEASPQANQTAAPLTTNTVTYAFDAAPDGFACPQNGGYGCVLRFNMPPEKTKSATPAKRATTPQTPAPSASPVSPLENALSNPSAPPSEAPKPSGPTMALTMTAMPNDAPKMVINTKTPVATTALIRILLDPSDDFTLDGAALAQFTLPPTEIPNRGFAVQIFNEDVRGKKHSWNPVLTIAHSTLDGATLTFRFMPPKLTLPKDHRYLAVLYGDARPATPTPAPTSAPTPPGNNPYVTPSPRPPF